MAYITKEDIEDITWDVINTFVIPDFDARNHNASGQWKRSLGVRAEPTRGVITGMDYTEFLTRGRNPNQDQSPEGLAHFARWAGHYIFTDWVKNKGLNLNPYAVAYNIAKEGTKVPKLQQNTFLKILETKEVEDFIIERLKGKATVRVVNTLRDELKKAVR